MSLRRKIPEEHENHERWLVSYADFITLLFAFFVVMYAVSSVNQGKYRELTSSLGSAFGSNRPIYIKTENQAPQQNASAGQATAVALPGLPLNRLKNERLRKEQESLTAMALKLSNMLSPLIQAGKLRVVQNNQGVRVDISESLLFSPGSADLSYEAKAPLMQIAQMLAEDRHDVQIEGHTDNVPIHNASFFSNWELSAVRASTVVRLFAESNIAENRLSAVGFGSAQPLADNLTAEGRAKNRRVSILVLYRSRMQSAADVSEIVPARF
ncbi:MAG TPA: flagellar motor protein MotD [Methylophilaceae bacterium]|nr:flagellar motor protein MotD [Methylophilaceae bacterium]